MDEIDHFHRQKDLVLIDGEDEATNSELDEGIMDLPSSEGEEYDSEGGDFDEGSLLDSQEEEEEEAWGRSKKNYYEADEGEEEEAREAARLQRKRLAALREEDFAASSKTAVKDRPYAFHLRKRRKGKKFPEESQGDFNALLVDFKEKLHHLKDHLEPALKDANSKAPELKHGMEFLRVKHRLLLAYCTCVAYYITMKLEGKNASGHPVFDRLVEYRLLLERIKPLGDEIAASNGSIVACCCRG